MRRLGEEEGGTVEERHEEVRGNRKKSKEMGNCLRLLKVVELMFAK